MVICHGQSHSDAMVNILVHIVIICGILTGRKNITHAQRNITEAVIAAAAVCFSLIFRIAIILIFR